MSSANTPFSTPLPLFPYGGTHQGNNGGPLRSASHHSLPDVSGPFPVSDTSGTGNGPDTSGSNLRDSRDGDNTSHIKRVGDVEESSTKASLNPTPQQDARAPPQRKPPFKETPQYFLNICHFLTVMNSWSDACDNQSSVPAPTNEFQFGQETVPQNTILELDDFSIPEVTEALTRMHSERESSMSYPQDYGLPPSAFMKQSASVSSSTPIVITANTNSIVEDDSPSITNTATDNHYIPRPNIANAVDVDTSWEDRHYNSTLYQCHDSNVTLPTNPNQLKIRQGHPDFFQISPEQTSLPLSEPNHNPMIIVHPPSGMIQPFPPQPLPAMTSLHNSTPSDVLSLSHCKRKRESEEVDAPNPTRHRKRRAILTTFAPSDPSSDRTLPDRWDTLLGSLPDGDPRKKGPPVTIEQDEDKQSYDKYTCLYSGPAPKEGGDICTIGITTNSKRNWYRHVSTHAADEEYMVENGTLEPEGVHALLWVKKNNFSCPEAGCGFYVEAWRVDGIRKTHMKKYHDVDSQRRQGNKGGRGGKENNLG